MHLIVDLAPALLQVICSFARAKRIAINRKSSESAGWATDEPLAIARGCSAPHRLIGLIDRRTAHEPCQANFALTFVHHMFSWGDADPR
jgi:hypothetical protein